MPKKKTPSSTATPHSIKFSREQLENQAWRLNNLYRIRNKTGTIVDFRFNRAQAELYKNLRHRNVILKARQLGMSTFVALYMLDHCLFKAGQSAGTVAHDLPSARGLFRDKIKFAFDNLDDQLRNLREPLTDSSDELVLGNGSRFRVATSMRSATLNLLHVSEFGKISLFHPDRAEEVINGTLPAVERDGMVFFESTAMGQDGYFYQMCAKAQELMRLKRPLSPLQYKFHFFPWYGEPDYVAKVTTPIEPYVQDYFAKLKAEHGIDLPPERQAWYQLMLETQQENMRREFPSVADEAFSATLEGTIYGHQLQRAEMEQRIKPYIAINRNHALCTAWDIGVDDATSIWIFQHLKQANGDPGPINFLSYYESNNEEASHYVKKIKEICDKNYWGKYPAYNFLPHEFKPFDWAIGDVRFLTVARMLGNRITVVPRHFVADGIDAVKEKFSRFHFSEAGCAEGLKMLRSYRREWDDDRGMFKDKPKHDKFSHGADALRYAVMGLRSHMPTKDIEIFPPDDPDKPDPNDKRTPVLVVGDSQTQRAISLTELFEHNEFGGRRRDRRI